MAISRWQAPDTAAAGPLDVLSWYSGPPVPDPVTFVISEDWLGKPNLYPRQVTLLKIIFLRDDLFTDYDRQVIDEWQQRFRETNPDAAENKFSAQAKGLQPDLYQRIAYLKKRGYKWFPELIIAIGRRGSKGYLSALAMSYVLWNYIAKGNPQEFYGIDQEKPLACAVFAGKKEQAKENLWGDLYSVITTAPCFTPYISEPQAESLTLYAPYDFVRMHKMAQRGISSTRDMASFRVVPRESTPLAPRGPAGCILAFDEAAHVKNAGVTREFGVVYSAAKPSLDQFGQDGFIVLPSSTWEMIGKFYELWQLALEREPAPGPGEYFPAYPTKFMVQLESWAIYEDWERAHLLPLFPAGFRGDLGEYEPEALPVLSPLKGAIQAYDEEMAREERANPDTFRVERRCIDPSTRVLTADLTWKAAGDIEVGDQLIGIDEHPPEPRKERRLRTTTVTATHRSRQTAYRMTFGDGTSVICSGEHRWLSASPGAGLSCRWRSLYAPPGIPGPRQGIRVGDKIRHIVDPWETDRSWQAGYLAGVFDGEGTVLGRRNPERGRFEFNITFAQNPGTVLEETLGFLRQLGFNPKDTNGTRKCRKWKVTGLGECLRFLGQVRPYRLLENAIPALWENRALGHLNGSASFKTITKIEELPERELVDLTTTTHTFIAEGLVSHNSDWATAMDAYLNSARIDDMFAPWADRDPQYGRPELTMQARGPLYISYTAHGDPASVNCRFGFAVAHTEPGPGGLDHAVFDLIHFWDPADFPDHIIDYDEIGDWILDNVVLRFQPDELTFDQWNSIATVQAIQKQIRAAHLQKNVVCYERTATAALNWSTYETFKAALNMQFVHAPLHGELRDELRFLQKPEGQQKVLPATSGPVQTKDVADCYHRSMEILTEHGWKLFPDVLDGERVATRNDQGELEYQHFTDRIERHYKGPMYQFEGKRLNFSVTPKHRMLVRPQGQGWQFIHAEDLKPGQVYQIPKTTMVPDSEPGIVDIDGDRISVNTSLGSRGGSRKSGGWSAEEDTWLTSHYPSMPMDALLQGLPGRTRGSVYNRVKKLGLRRGQIGDRHGDRPKPLPPVSRELFAGFLGIWLADGRKYHHGTHRGYGVRIPVTKARKVQYLEDLLTRTGWPYLRSVTAKGETVFEIRSHGLREYLKALCTGDHELHLPDEVFTEWTADEMRALMQGLMTGDGSFSGKYQRFTRYDSTSRLLVDDIQRLMLHIGMSGQVRKMRSAGDSVSGSPGYTAKHDGWYVGSDVRGSGLAMIRGSQIEQVDYDGPVYCLTVPNGTLLVRRQGVAMWAGNCIAIVTTRLLGEQMKAYLAKDLKNQRPRAANLGGNDALDRFSPEQANPFAGQLGSLAGRGGLARGLRPAGRAGLPGRPTAGSRAGLAGSRRHRS